MLLFYIALVLVIQVSADQDLGWVREEITQNVINRSPYDSIPKVGNKPVTVSISFFLRNIHEANEKENEVRVSVVFAIQWTDRNLKWDDDLYAPAYQIREVAVPLKDIWAPNIQVTAPVGMTELYSSEIVNVKRDGQVFWAPQMTFRANCDLYNLTTENYATCIVNVAPWRFPSQEVAVTCPPSGSILAGYVKSSKYQVMNATQRANNRVKFNCCPDSFDNADLIFTFKRK